MRLSTIIVLALAAGTVHAQFVKVPARDTEQNVTATILQGVWEVDHDLNQSLGLGGSSPASLSFSFAEGAVPDEVLEARNRDLAAAGKALTVPIYAMGMLVIERNGTPHSFPFILSTIHGNPHVVYFRERNGDPFGDSESFIVMGIRTSEEDGPGPNDRLFIGGDFNNEPLRAYRRLADE